MPRGTLRQAQGGATLWPPGAPRSSSKTAGAARPRGGLPGGERLSSRDSGSAAGQRLGLRGSCSARGAAALGWLAASEDRGAAAALPGPTAGEARAGAWASHGAPLTPLSGHRAA